MDDDIGSKARIYTDMQGLQQLKYNDNTAVAKKEIAHQFEAMFMQLVLRSMRDANKSFSSGLFSNNQMDFYQDMLDKQLSLMMSNSNLGFAKIVEKNIDQFAHNDNKTNTTHASAAAGVMAVPVPEKQEVIPQSIDQIYAQHAADHGRQLSQSAEPAQGYFSSAEEFVKKLWSTAKAAAGSIGAAPEILLAQAALETNWGKNILAHNNHESSHNLFNIKAGLGWNSKTATAKTIEQKDGVLVRETSKFRSYDSYKESFMDYIHLLKNNSRYHEAVNKASDPERFIQAVQNAGYATDPGYADKILKIFSSKTFQGLIAKIKNI